MIFKNLFFSLSILTLCSPCLFLYAATPLQNNIPVTGLSGEQNSETFFTLTLPAGAQNLEIAIASGSGDADLYLREGAPPSTVKWDCRPYQNGSNESCSIATPEAGVYHVMIRGYSSYSGLSLTGSYQTGTGVLVNGVGVPDLTGDQNSQTRFYLDVPSGATALSFNMTGGTGDADLYVRYDAEPTLSTYDCRPWVGGNEETCDMGAPQAGRWHLMLVGYNSYAGVTLTGAYEGGGPDGCGPDVDGGISVNMLGDGNVTTNTYSSWIRMQGDVLADFDLSVCQQPTYGVITFSGDPIELSNGFDQNFSYNYTHLGPRPGNDDSFALRVTSNGNTSIKTIPVSLGNPVVNHPVQPVCGNIDVDADGDGIPDCAELPGTTFYGMPLYDWGARTNQLDLFIEVDYMPVHPLMDYDGNPVLDSNGDPIMDHGTQPLRESLDRVVALFAERGYSVHFDIGDLYDQSPGLDPDDYDLGGGQEIPFEEYVHLNRWTDHYNGRDIAVPGMTEDFMPSHFETNPERLRAFYYLLFANSQGGSNRGSSGQAPDTFDYWYYLSMGGTGWRMNDDTAANRNMLINAHASTIFHEFGHVLGLGHGGNPEGTTHNFKPNYLSSMNYLYQLQGVPADFADQDQFDMILDRYQLNWGFRENPNCGDLLRERQPDNSSWGNLLHGLFGDPAEFHINYSDGDKASINESSLTEIGTLSGMDYNCDGLVTGDSGSFDINFDDSTDTLHDFNDWDSLYPYYRYLNYSNGKFLIAPNPAAQNAWWPTQAFGASRPPINVTGQPIGTEEMVPPPEAFEALHRLQNR